MLGGGLCHAGKDNPKNGRSQSEKCKEVNSVMRLGKSQTKESNERRSKTLKGRNWNSTYGPEKAEVYRKALQLRLSIRSRKNYELISPDGGKIIVDNLKDFCGRMGFSYHSFRGAIWKYGHSHKFRLIGVPKQ